MTVEVVAVAPADFLGRGVLRYYDTQSECAFFVSEPGAQPVLWRRYLDGALDVYRCFGVEHALEYDAVVDGRSTSLFFAAVDSAGDVVAGVRMQGPYTAAGQAHALLEWAGHAGESDLRLMIADRIPEGVVEAKGAWVSRAAPPRAELSAAISRAVLHGARLLGARYGFATAASITAGRHRECGAVLDERIPAVPYPDDRYRTVPLWWDTRTYSAVAEESQRSLVVAEQEVLAVAGAGLPELRHRVATGVVGGCGHGR
ncbi:hypothetical protein AB0B25_02390 [Nocardia sp. NPDC049190]|uniref:hypothetical protein n=1 Tax=Nocardia sp. NPDC049190 TaxID=3155650 RepID=UPI0033FAA2AA